MTTDPPSQSPYRQILGIRFFTGTVEEAVALGLRGGLVAVPSAPVFVSMVEDPANRDALLGSDFAIADSGLMVLVWNLIKRDNIRRVSGLAYLKTFLEQPAAREPHAIFWVMPSRESMIRNLAWLNQQGHPTTEDDCYLAPQYGAGPIIDEALVKILNARKPAHIIMAIGGGVQ